MRTALPMAPEGAFEAFTRFKHVGLLSVTKPSRDMLFVEFVNRLRSMEFKLLTTNGTNEFLRDKLIPSTDIGYSAKPAVFENEEEPISLVYATQEKLLQAATEGDRFVLSHPSQFEPVLRFMESPDLSVEAQFKAELAAESIRLATQ